MATRFPFGPGSELDPISDAYIAAVRAEDADEVERLRNEVYRVTGPFVGPRSMKASRKFYSELRRPPRGR